MTRPSPLLATAALALIVAAAGVLYLTRLGEAPIHVSTDEAKFAVQAHSIASTGRDLRGNFMPLFVLIVDPLVPEQQSVAWWQPELFYLMAAVFRVTPVSEWSTRLPVAALAVLNVLLIAIVARRLFGSPWYGVFAAWALALTPSHFILGREAADYFLPTTVALLWLWSVQALLANRASRAAAITGVVLGAGLYSYITSWFVMPIYLALTHLAAWRAKLPFRLHLWIAGVFVAFFIPVLVWALFHPSMFLDTMVHYHVGGGLRLAERMSLFWNYFNPSYLYFSGGSSLLWATRQAGVFLLPLALLIPLGLWYLLARARSIAGDVILVGFFLVPLPIIVALPEAPAYATARAVLALPYGVLIATAGLTWLVRLAPPIGAVAAAVAIVAMPLQFASFAADYFTDYRMRSAIWIDAMNFRSVADHVIASDATQRIPVVYVSQDDIGEDKTVKWKYHLITSGRLDLFERTRYMTLEDAGRPEQPAGSLLLMRAANPRVNQFEQNGWRVEKVIDDATGTPATAVLRKN